MRGKRSGGWPTQQSQHLHQRQLDTYQRQLDLQHATGLLTDAQLRQAKAQLVAQRAVEEHHD